MNDIQNVLEPSCGSCEYILALKEKYEVNITGIEFNDTIYESIKHLHNNIIHNDFIQYDFDKTFDLIIGNPPYFVMKKKDVNKEYYKYFDGRPNIFILFIIITFHLIFLNYINPIIDL